MTAPMTRLEILAHLERMGACEPARTWVASLDCVRASTVWRQCDRANWLIWLVVRTVPRDVRVRLACDYAERVAEIGESWLRQHAPEHAGAIVECITATRSGDPERIRVARMRLYDARRVMWHRDADADDAAAYAAYAAAAYAAAEAADDASFAATFAAYADADAERAWQIAHTRTVVSWADVERGLRGAA